MSLTLLISIPVKASTDLGRLATISRISEVILLAPTSHLPLDTITIFLHWEIGAATSAAICEITIRMSWEELLAY